MGRREINRAGFELFTPCGLAPIAPRLVELGSRLTCLQV